MPIDYIFTSKEMKQSLDLFDPDKVPIRPEITFILPGLQRRQHSDGSFIYCSSRSRSGYFFAGSVELSYKPYKVATESVSLRECFITLVQRYIEKRSTEGSRFFSRASETEFRFSKLQIAVRLQLFLIELITLRRSLQGIEKGSSLYEKFMEIYNAANEIDSFDDLPSGELGSILCRLRDRIEPGFKQYTPAVR